VLMIYNRGRVLTTRKRPIRIYRSGSLTKHRKRACRHVKIAVRAPVHRFANLAALKQAARPVERSAGSFCISILISAFSGRRGCL